MTEITPKTKVGELLDNYPQLEEVLLKLSPAFAGLKNPILRKTVAKVASLQQAAVIGNIKVDELVNKLRNLAGQEPLFSESIESEYIVTELPSWVDKSKIVTTFDAREIIESGGSPMSQILEQTKYLEDGDILILIAPFIPAPILDMLKGQGFKIVSQKVENYVLSYIGI